MQYVSVPLTINLQDINQGLARTSPRVTHVRSRGTHLTDILQKMSKDSGRLKEKIFWGRSTYDPLDEDDLPVCMFVGLAIENMFMRMYPELEKSEELLSDGIAMSPDAVAFESRGHKLWPQEPVTVLHEFKATWKSSRSPIEEKVQYLQQTKSYCRALKTPLCVLWVCHVMGDYRFGEGTGPSIVQHHIMYSQFELESNWAEVVRKKAEYAL